MNIYGIQVTKYIDPKIEIWHAYRREIGNNGLSADAWLGLFIAPAVADDTQYLYVETNGDPVVVGWIDQNCGQVILLDDVARWIDEPDMAWLKDTLDNYAYGAD